MSLVQKATPTIPKPAVQMNPKSKSRNNRDAPIGFRPTPLLRAAIVKWAERQGERLTLSQAVCQLVESGLKVKEAGRSAHRQGRCARRMAGETINHMIDSTMTADNKAVRKRRLLDEPEEFSRVRVDRRKASRSAGRGQR
ncbi:hypothetical protein [Bradyrhizobium sp. CB2312]|uniref:hypothetical protein n=1 Tax=Bradyrhizobium sp. CB2312 TaxID=3039155 RepID=UPI0024B24032|nr:hypothetical protein [Bradyrhizobium sp. CB2312]WFU69201.1 hypothetical protein QA642_28340 [Bradyrhizobium sp. CB2312]